MTAMTFQAMSDAEIERLNTAYQQNVGLAEPEAITSMVAWQSRLYYVRWERAGSYWKNGRNQLVFGLNSGGFVTPPQTTFEFDDE